MAPQATMVAATPAGGQNPHPSHHGGSHHRPRPGAAAPAPSATPCHESTTGHALPRTHRARPARASPTSTLPPLPDRLNASRTLHAGQNAPPDLGGRTHRAGTPLPSRSAAEPLAPQDAQPSLRLALRPPPESRAAALTCRAAPRLKTTRRSSSRVSRHHLRQ
jgi:hypothetical protein